MRPHCFILTEACSRRLELAYFAGRICKNRLVCKNAVAVAHCGSCRLLVMGSWCLDIPMKHCRSCMIYYFKVLSHCHWRQWVRKNTYTISYCQKHLYHIFDNGYVEVICVISLQAIMPEGRLASKLLQHDHTTCQIHTI